ncbi:DUF6232 family protein [Actinoplanes oblitus]|uniref:DUF6232 family protein n=1 Tax=Actinoplanes oblitus TaxID=3040509 RepID=A0ABY8WP42_9ACTN|nr:DUF6232 family protein [Actinoplanes oblitus]WIM99639.1 DUF6232 family protein [Actinoplanes oblitus]
MRIYYRDADITVAASGVRVGGRTYPLADIERAWREARRAAGPKARLAWVVLLVAVAVEASIWLTTRWLWAGRGLLLVAGVLLVRVIAHLAAGSSGLQAMEDIRRYGRLQELWISVARVPVRVLRTDDAIRYGQVCRALARALADHDAATRPPPERADHRA